MAVSLPQDVILLQIITRVPTKSAICFKCVSKQWNSFLMSDRFKEMHNDHNLLKDYVCTHLEDRNLFFYSCEAATFYTIDCESPPDHAPCIRPLPQFVARPPQYTRILTSFDGLVCLGLRKTVHGDFDIILWNPVTTEYKRLSKPSNPDQMECMDSGSGYGMFYCSVEDDYQLVVVTESGNAYIYSLKSDSWGNLDTKPPFQDFWSPGFCLNKYLYFLCDMDPDILNEGSMSMRFDTEAKRFQKIKTPPLHNGMDAPPSTAISVHKGYIHLCVKYDYSCSTDCTCIEVWKFIADGDIWRKVVTYQLQPNHDIGYMSPVHLMSNGNLLMIDYKDGGPHICQVDLTKKKYTKDKKDGRKSQDKNKSKGNYHGEYKLLYYSNFTVGWPWEVMYTETFLSPNRYMK